MMVSKFGISYFFGAFFMVNHVNFWEGMTPCPFLAIFFAAGVIHAAGLLEETGPAATLSSRKPWENVGGSENADESMS